MEAEAGILIVETIAKIRRAYFSDCKSIKAICRELRLSRKVVRKVIRSGETSFSYERTVQPRPKLGQWTVVLEELLETNAAKPAREQLTLIRIFEELRGRGYRGGYDAVRRYARRWAKERGQSTAAAYVPLSFAPGVVKVAHLRHLTHLDPLRLNSGNPSGGWYGRGVPFSDSCAAANCGPQAVATNLLLPNGPNLRHALRSGTCWKGAGLHIGGRNFPCVPS